MLIIHNRVLYNTDDMLKMATASIADGSGVLYEAGDGRWFLVPRNETPRHVMQAEVQRLLSRWGRNEVFIKHFGDDLSTAPVHPEILAERKKARRKGESK